MQKKSAKEWLQEEELIDGHVDILKGDAYKTSIIMERFANYRTADIQASVINFRMRLKGQIDKITGAIELECYQHILENFDATFGITEARNGKI